MDDCHLCHLKIIIHCHDSYDGNDDEEEDYLDADDGHSSDYRLKSANIAIIVIDYSRYQGRGQKIGILMI